MASDASVLRVVLLGADALGTADLAARLAPHLHAAQLHLSVWGLSNLAPLARTAAPCEGVAAVLLTGVPTAAPAAERLRQEQDDGALRLALQEAGLAYRVVYGQGDQRLRHALSALAHWLNAHLAAPAAAPTAAANPSASALQTNAHAAESGSVRLRHARCDECVDPASERRLFTALIEKKSGLAPSRA